MEFVWTTKKVHQAIKLNDTGKLSLCAATHLLSIKIQFRNAATRFLRGGRGPVGMWQGGPMEWVVLDSQNDLSSEMQSHLGVLRRRRKDFAAQGPG